MSPLPDDTLAPILEMVDQDRLGAHLDWCSGVRRDTGGPGEKKMVDYIVDTLAAEGMTPTVHEFDAYLSYPRHAVIEVLAPERKTIRCVTHSFATSTGPDGLTGTVDPDSPATVDPASGETPTIDWVIQSASQSN